MYSFICNIYYILQRRIFLISWISFVLYFFYDTYTYYRNGQQFYYIREILGLGLCVSRGTASILNMCCALVLLPFFKKLNQILYQMLSKAWPGLFFFWLERAKSFHITVAITLLIFAVIHSASHFVNLWNFSRGYDEIRKEINFANYRNENPLLLLLSVPGLSGVSMLLIILSMGLTSMRAIRRRFYNVFWYTHQFYFLFMALLIVHPLSGVLKEELISESEATLNGDLLASSWSNSSTDFRQFVPIRSNTLLWMAFPLSCFFFDLLWRILSRNRAKVDILKVNHMAGRTLSLTLSLPHDKFTSRMGQYVLLQCPDISVLEWHPFTIVKVHSSSQKYFKVWLRVKGDWTESLEKLTLDNRFSLLVDGPYCSPMEGASVSETAICVAAGVGITPFVALLDYMLRNPRSRLPGRVHLLWIIRYEQEITWLAELATKTISQLRNANRPDRLHIELYVTNDNTNNNYNNKEANPLKIMIVNDKGVSLVVKNETSDEKATLLTPNVQKHVFAGRDNTKDVDNKYNLAKDYPILACRVKRGRPHWDRVFGYWVHLYPVDHLNLYCCGPKKLVKLLRNKCKYTSRNTKTKFTFVHEGFS